MSNFKDYEIFVDNLKQKIKDLELRLDPKDFGVVINVGDGIACIAGLDNVSLGEVVTFLDNGTGIVMGIEPSFVNVMLLSKVDAVKEGVEVFSTKQQFGIFASDALLGRVLNALGKPIDGGDDIKCGEFRSIEADPPGIMARYSVCEPLQTGVKILDALIPIGLGQKQLILGDRQSGKTTLAIDTILNQRNIKDAGDKFTYCIYVAIGRKNSDIAKIYELLKKHNAMEYTIIIATSASEPAAMQYVAPMAGAAIAEYFRDQGKDALVVFDDLTKHADAYREISLLMRRTPARGAYPGDVFYLHARLLERAVKMRKENGGGSVTMLPIIETQAGDISDYIPTNVISITDGQVYLDKQLFFSGQKPAINIGISVSRIGSAAQYKIMRKIAGRLKMELAQFREYEAFSKSVSDLDEETQKMLERGRLLVSLFNQTQNKPLGFEKMIICLFAGIHGLLHRVKFKTTLDVFEDDLFTFVKNRHPDVVKMIKLKDSFDENIEDMMIAAIKEFVEQY